MREDGMGKIRGKNRKKKPNGAPKRNAALRKAASPPRPKAGLWSALTPQQANYAPLSPMVFLARAAEIYPGRPAVVHGATRFTYRQVYERAKRLASALRKSGVRPGDVVAGVVAHVPGGRAGDPA